LPSERIWLVSPIYYDVESYCGLRDGARAALAVLPGIDVRFVAVDDSAGSDPDIRRLEQLPEQTVITPPFPLGHQRALVFGLRRLSATVDETDLVVTLDADGEDKPEDLPRLLAPLRDAGASVRTVVVAARTHRRESLPFKLLYLCFKAFFQLLTGTVIRSGNYAAYRGWLTRNVLFHPQFDLSYSSGLLSLGLNVRREPCERGVRYAGASKMTYVKLIQHGLRMLMPFADRIATRGLIVLATFLALGLVAGIVMLVLRASGYELPVWTIAVLVSALLLAAFGVACLVIVFALFVQSQSLSLSRLDSGLRQVEDATPGEASPRVG
jgi:hypothetical protein